MLHRAAPEVPIVAVDTEARRVTVQLLRWNEPRDVSDDGGRTVYREAYAVDALELADDIGALNRHHGDLVGRVDPDSYRVAGDGPTVDVILSRSSSAADVLADIETGVIRSVSVEVEPLEQIERDGVTIRTRARLHNIAFAFRPAHDAPILAVRESPEGVPIMPDTETGLDLAAVDARVADLIARSADTIRDGVRDDLLRELPAIVAGPAADTGARSDLMKFRTWGDFAHAIIHAEPAEAAALNRAAAEEVTLLTRALADQVPADNPGVMRPTWLTEVAGSFARSRPVVSAFGSTPKRPGEGGTFNWPAFEGDITTLVGDQATPKTEITSVSVDLVNKTANAQTWAGGSDIAYQLIRNSTPSYLDEYRSLMSQGYAVHSEAKVGAALVAAATASAAVWDPAADTVTDLVVALVAGSIEVEAATGAPAQFALASSDVFLAIATYPELYSPAYGVQTVRGVADARTLAVSVQNMPIIHARYLASGTLILSNGEAASVFEDGPMVATAEDVGRLGHNWAIWGQGVFAPRIPTGIRKVNAA